MRNEQLDTLDRSDEIWHPAGHGASVHESPALLARLEAEECDDPEMHEEHWTPEEIQKFEAWLERQAEVSEAEAGIA